MLTHPHLGLPPPYSARIGSFTRPTSAPSPPHTNTGYILTARIGTAKTPTRAQLTWRETIIKNGKKNK